MKKFVIALTALAALVATPAMARDGTHISVGFYSPAPIYYEPPVVVYPPVRHVYYAPQCPRRVAYGYGRGHGWGHTKFRGGYATAWNDNHRYDRDDDRGGYDYDDDHGRGEDWHR